MSGRELKRLFKQKGNLRVRIISGTDSYQYGNVFGIEELGDMNVLAITRLDSGKYGKYFQSEIELA